MATITTVNPGNLVVPLSAIIDHLQGKLTSAELNALLLAVVGDRRNEVRPGDLITADLINQILRDLEDLNARLAAVQGGGATTGNSAAVVTLHDAWQAWEALAKNGSFLPTTNTADAIKSAVAISTHLQDAGYAALIGGALAHVAGSTTLLAAFRRLYDRQRDIVILFSAPIAGIPDTSRHQQFATLLNVLLEQDDVAGGASLKKALDNSDVTAAIGAQDRINGMLRNQGGDVTTGNLAVTYHGAVGSTETLVVGSTTPVLYRFFVANKTNRSLVVQLGRDFLPPRQAWRPFATIVDLAGNARATVALGAFNPANPEDPAAKQEVRVAVTTPTGAVDGDKGVLQFEAFVPHPVNVRSSATRELEVKNTAVPQTPGIVAYTPESPVVSGDLSNATELIPVGLEFRFNFAKGTGPATRQFRFKADITEPAANPDALFLVEFTPSDVAVDPTASTANQKTSKSFSMNDGALRTVTVVVTPGPGSKNSNFKFKATVESATDGVKAESPTFTVAVKNP
jgi:hypothetical protein